MAAHREGAVVGKQWLHMQMRMASATHGHAIAALPEGPDLDHIALLVAARPDRTKSRYPFP